MMRERTRYHEDGLQDYLKAAGKFPVLTREEEVALFQRLEAGDESAREEIIRCNLRFVIKVALKFRSIGIPMADLIQEGNIGLLHVIDKFDWRKGFRFSTYAAYYIRQEIQAAIHRNASLIRLPVRKARLLGKIQEVYARYNETEGRDPSIKEIAFEVDQPVDKIEPLMALRHSFASLDVERTDDNFTLADTLPADTATPSAQIEEVQTRQAVNGALDYLTERERKVIELRFGMIDDNELSLRGASKLIGLSQEGVRRVEHRALDKLRRPAIRGRLDGLLTA